MGVLGARALIGSAVGEQPAECRSGVELLAAFANPAVQNILLYNSVRMPGEAGSVVAPIPLLRNLTVVGAHEEPSEWPVLDFANIHNVVALGAGVTFRFRRIVTNNTREAPHFQAIGIDVVDGRGVQSAADAAAGKVLAHPTAAPSGAAVAFVMAEDSCIIQRSCLPASYRAASMSGLPRPAVAPGPQLTYSVSQEGCVNDSAAPAMRRCWAEAGYYEDVVAQAADLDEYGGKPVPANYVLWLRNVRYVCDWEMSEECAAKLGPVGCYYQRFPRVAAGSPPRALAPLLPQAAAGDGGGGGGGPGSGGGPPLGAILGGMLGGVAFIAAVAAVLAVLVRGAQRRRLSGGKHLAELRSIDTEGEGGASGEDTSASLACSGALHPAYAASAASAPSPSDPGDPASLPLPPDPAAPAHTADPSDPHSALVPVTRLTPLRPEVRLDVDQEVTLLPVTRGKGSYGKVVEGMYGGQRVAVKLLDWGLAGAPPAEGGGEGGGGEGGAGEGGAGEGGGNGKAAKRRMQASQNALAQEVEVLGRCHHPNIVRLLAASLQPPSVCLVMELCDTSLERLLYDRGPEGPPPPYDMGPPYDSAPPADRQELLPLDTVLHIAIEVAQGLAYLHPTILHRDLKPANVLISNPASPHPIVKLADFGLSRLHNTVLVTRHPEAGTASYMAPETFDLKNFTITDRTDMYSCGVMLWEMLAGAPPWYGWTSMQVAIAITLRGERLPLCCLSEERCPPKLRKLILACFEADPARRPAAAEAVKVLTLVQQELARPSDGAPPPPLVSYPSKGPSSAKLPPRCIGVV